MQMRRRPMNAFSLLDFPLKLYERERDVILHAFSIEVVTCDRWAPRSRVHPLKLSPQRGSYCRHIICLVLRSSVWPTSLMKCRPRIYMQGYVRFAWENRHMFRSIIKSTNCGRKLTKRKYETFLLISELFRNVNCRNVTLVSVSLYIFRLI